MRECVQWGRWMLAVMLASGCGKDGEPQGGDSSTSTPTTSAESSESSSTAPAESTGSVDACETILDVCAQIPVEDVNAALDMTMLDTATPQNMDAPAGPLNGCNYAMMGSTIVALTRNCFADGATAAQEYYQTQKDGPATSEGEMVVEVAGLGTDAHLRIVPIGDNASLVVLDGPRVHLARRLGTAMMMPDQIEAQLRPLAEAMLALD